MITDYDPGEKCRELTPIIRCFKIKVNDSGLNSVCNYTIIIVI